VGATLVRTCNWFDPVVQNSWERRELSGAFLLLVPQILSFCGLPLFSHLLMDATNDNAAEDEDDEDKRRWPRAEPRPRRRRLLITAEKNYVIEGLEGVSQELQHQNSHLQ